jgi:hypothetical protein
VRFPYPLGAENVRGRDSRRRAGAVTLAAMKASRWEILGAWLKIWTPPRDVEIPPVPRRAVALLAAFCVALAAVVVVVIAPALNDAQERRDAREARVTAAAQRAERVRLRHDQRVHRARAGQAARLYAADRRAQARAALVADVTAGVRRDADARAASGEFDQATTAVRCVDRPGGAGERVLLRCLAISSQNSRVRVGQPFVVAASLRDGRYAWCHVNPPPGEGSAGRGVFVALAKACTE